MKITSIKATPINVPLSPGYVWSVGNAHGYSKTIIEVTTDEGIVGLGESPSSAYAALIESDLAPVLEGLDPFDIATTEQTAMPELRSGLNFMDAGLARAYGGIEIALWDIKAKALGVPLYQLLGGAVRRDIQFTEFFGYRVGPDDEPVLNSTAALVDYCLEMKETHGSTIFEGKVGCLSAREDVAMLTALREALGADVQIRIDANYGWSLSTARSIVRELEDLQICNIEDPVLGYENMARLREQTWIPFSTHEINLPRAVELGAPDAFVANFASLGGIRETMRFASACDVMGRDFWAYSGDAGIMTAAYLHLSAALPSMRLPHQSLGRLAPFDVVAENVLKPHNNVVAVPEGPGLGVTIDPAALQKLHQMYLDEGASVSISRGKQGLFNRLPRY
ncbi:mandelate racemase/muconate lactonizing enzyme family protein [Rhodococcus sp. NPDC056960]|uniref:mandelate racemase/muconate lactonizing enzyme family protein n=1 Tax=Rhodococcus sp. NPDC056960 TaxID=3345982 RepID=UPI00363DC0D1